MNTWPAALFAKKKNRSYARSLLPKVRQQKIAEAFHVKKVDDFPLPPWDYNVAPTSMQPVIRNNRHTGERELVSLLGPDSVLHKEAC